jgi:GNAT superfamily N-acetyltransferase
MIKIERTTSKSKDFILLTKKLDQELKLIYGSTQEEFDQFNIIDNIETVIVAYKDNTAGGCGCFKTFDKNTAELKRMFVDDQFRGKGIGAAILIELENWVKELGYSSIVLETGTVQVKAIALYKKFGYSVISNFDPYIGNELSICLKKNLQ